jgi:hypothetical protein
MGDEAEIKTKEEDVDEDDYGVEEECHRERERATVRKRMKLR